MPSKPSRVAVITGGEGDLARSFAAALNEAGYAVHAPGRGDLDVCSADSVDAYFARDGIRDGVDLLVCNAGIRRDAPVARLSEEDWDAVLDTNLKGAFLCCRAVLKSMFRRRTGHVVGVGSHSALTGPVGQAAYAASKAGLIGLLKSIALEGGRRNVRANGILPGFLRTKFVEGMSPATVDTVQAAHVLGEFNTAADAGRFLVHLDRMTRVSGQVFQLDSRVGR